MERKYRAWDRVRLGWLSDDSNVWLITPDGKAIINPDECDSKAENIEIVQYTGLIGKNGKEIYEGDIVYCKYNPGGNWMINQNGVVKWQSTGWYFEGYNNNSQRGGLQAWFTQIPGAFNDEVSGRCSTLEIIGNIYENPELLKEKATAKASD